MKIPRRMKLSALSACVAILCGFLAWDNVSTALTASDRDYIEKILEGRRIAPPTTFEEQIATILEVQDAVLTAAPDSTGLPLGSAREPKDLYLARSGACYDRSRVIEKTLSYYGIEVRHVAVYSKQGTSTLVALLTPHDLSHAVTEARTTKGWIAIDSNDRWIGLTADRQPVSVSGIPAARNWSPSLRAPLNDIFRKPYVEVIGLYSRHGQFYAPYLPFPNVNLGQFLENLFG